MNCDTFVSLLVEHAGSDYIKILGHVTCDAICAIATKHYYCRFSLMASEEGSLAVSKRSTQVRPKPVRR